MVNGVTVPEFLLHQSLHGYADGHRQIAMSTSLKPNDTKTLMTLSDSSGPNARFPDSGYLTGYPLVESGYYVLARTWAAPEMPRPGCVWTHSLLIDFSDLAILPEMSELLRFFRRPSLDNFASYGTGLVFERPDFFSEFSINSEAVRLVASLYDDPHARVIASSTTGHSETLVLRIWAQQWPRLRRNFRFCTFSAGDRSIESHSFDVQLIPSHNRSVRSSFTNVV